MITLTNEQARRFLFVKHGLLGPYHFIGKQGAYDYIRQTGCIQFDPIDVCGKNAELCLQSRVKDFKKQMLFDLLYIDRLLFDYPDKNLSIIPLEDWPYFGRYRKAARESGLRFKELPALEHQAKIYMQEHGPVSSEDLPIEGSIHWHSAIHWSGAWNGMSNAARSVLEQLYSTGELVIHHKKGSRKYYDLSERYISADLLEASDPFTDDADHQKWRVYRRIGAVGLLWNRSSDAWLGIWEMRSPQRMKYFQELKEEEKITEVKVEGMRDVFYCQTCDLELMEKVQKEEKWKPRCELIAPLDCLMWDRKLIKTLFGFDYTWEIYTPANKRKYGFYVLPMIYGDCFIGRVEAAATANEKAETLLVKHIWYEEGIKETENLKLAVEECLKRFALFNNCKQVKYLGT